MERVCVGADRVADLGVRVVELDVTVNGELGKDEGEEWERAVEVEVNGGDNCKYLK
jgi:hypothetical protein